MNKNLITVITLQDRVEPDEIFWTFTAKLNIKRGELQDKVDDIIKDYNARNFNDWTFEDIVADLEKANILKVVESDELVINA